MTTGDISYTYVSTQKQPSCENRMWPSIVWVKKLWWHEIKGHMYTLFHSLAVFVQISHLFVLYMAPNSVALEYVFTHISYLKAEVCLN